jgi:cation-transporting ATPase 13A1
MDEALQQPTFTLLARRTVRLDIVPFAILYVIGFGAYLLGSPKVAAAANIATPICAGLHIITFLSCHWWLSTRCALQLKRVHRVADATLVRTHPVVGRSELCTLEVRPAAAPAAAAAKTSGTEAADEVRFDFRKRVYMFTPGATPAADEATCFRELTMPVGLSLSHYLASARGLRGESLAQAEYKYGGNSFAIPARTFGSLFVEHALAPFFVFQASSPCKPAKAATPPHSSLRTLQHTCSRPARVHFQQAVATRSRHPATLP